MDTDTKSPTTIINAFAKTVSDLLQHRRTVYIAASKFDVFSELPSAHFLKVKSVNDVPSDQLFDVIWGSLPLGVLIFDLLQFLSDDGIGFFLLVEPNDFSTTRGRRFQTLINKEGYFINAIFDAPKNLLQPETGLTPAFVAVSRTEKDKVFVGELSTLEQATQVASNFVESKDAATIGYGTFIERNTFNGFNQLRALFQIERLETQYHLFEKYVLRELADEINTIRSNERHKDKPNSIYIPKIGNSKVIAKLEDASLKHHNYFQVVLNARAVSNYVASFFQSAIGRLVLQSLSISSFIPHIKKRDIENAVIALPNLSQQKEIVDTHKRLEKLKQAIDRFDQEISAEPYGDEAYSATT